MIFWLMRLYYSWLYCWDDLEGYFTSLGEEYSFLLFSLLFIEVLYLLRTQRREIESLKYITKDQSFLDRDSNSISTPFSALDFFLDSLLADPPSFSISSFSFYAFRREAASMASASWMYC